MKVVYRYGLHAPHEGADIVHEQMRLAHRFYNTLVAIERGRRAAVRAVESEAADLPAVIRAFAAADEVEANAYRAIKRHRAETRKRDESERLKVTLAEAKAIKREASLAVRAARAAIKTGINVQTARDRIGELAKLLANNAYDHSGCYWGQRALVMESAADSFADTPMYTSDWTPNEPRFKRYIYNAGAVGLQIMGGISVSALHGCEDSRVRLRAPDARAWSGARSERRAYGSTAELWLRVGSDGRAPVWAKWACDMPRALPSDAKIVWVSVHQRDMGPHCRWSVSITIETAGAALREPTAGGSVAVDIGWRVMGDRLRGAGWQDSRGARGELSLDAATLAALHEPEMIRSERDERFELARNAFARWLDAAGEYAPPWLRESARNVRQWHSPARLSALCRKMENAEGDLNAAQAAMLRDLACWERRDRHLWACETRRRERALARRREIYRVFAARLADRYDTIVVEQFDLRKVAAVPVIGEKEDVTQNETARSNRVIAALSDLIGALKLACKSRGRELRAASAVDSTRACPNCGLVEDRRAAESVRLRCECGAEWDQDIDGAPAVLLAREHSSDTKIIVSARKNGTVSDLAVVMESRWARVRRLRAEKEARMRSAREADDKCAE